ncbi:MAG TPA: HAD family acid phosphatase [Acidobacteriaceae bacterium]|jgi:hypothetical protein|nr:HAD family acid phosphatase [Acidobacteriaceae bacterium]
MSGWKSWVAAVGLIAAVASAQTGVSGTPKGAGTPDGVNGHYGPPACATERAATYRDRVAKAHREQEEGADTPHALVSAEPLRNLDIERYRIEDYANCVGTHGCYWADLDTQYKRAEAALAIEVKRHKPGERLAIVFDIDETVLSKFCQMPVENYGYLQKMDDEWTLSAQGLPIPGALRLFNEAKADGVAVFFITGRPGVPRADAVHPREDQTEATERNLEAAGFHGWAGLALKNHDENGMKVIPYKSLERKKIEDKGYRIVMSVGDQWSDLEGAPQAEVSVKLPNPFYFIE